MRTRIVDRKTVLASVLLGLSLLSQTASLNAAFAGGELPGLTLERALEVAFEGSPALRARRADVNVARGRLMGARTHPFNPRVDVEVGRRRGLDRRTTDRGVNLSQEIELAGQRGQRVAASRAELDAAEAGFLREKRLLAAKVELAFAKAVRARELRRIAERDVGLARDFRVYARRRLEAGAASQIELNLALATAGRAERQFSQSEATDEAARSVLAEVTGLDPAAPPRPEGDFLTPSGPLPAVAELLEGALRWRADLLALRSTAQSAQVRVKLARSEAWPNLNLGGFYAEEEGSDSIIGGRISITLPLFNRNQGPIAEARAKRDRVRAESAALRLTVLREVTVALARHRAARTSAERLREQVLGTLEENLDLLQRSFEAGKIGATDVLIFRREFVETQREFIEAAFEAWATRIALDLATGRLSVPDGHSVSVSKESQ